jgi:hypothetical protein
MILHSLFLLSTLGSSSITIIDAGDISSSQGFIQIDNEDVTAIAANTGNVFLVIDFDSSNNNSGVITVSSETNNQPIVLISFLLDYKIIIV